jgi:hypothetical protein
MAKARNEMVDLIKKSIIFFFLNGIIHYFLSSSNSFWQMRLIGKEEEIAKRNR